MGSTNGLDHARISLGLIGCGERGRVLLRTAVKHPLFDVRAISDSDPRSLDLAARIAPSATRFSRAGELLDCDLEAVLIATPPMSHAELSIAALHSGKDVMSEVPAVMSIEEAEALVTAIKVTGRYYALAENSCFGETVQSIKHFLDHEELGPYLHGEGTYSEDCREDTRGIIYNRETGEPFWRASYPMCNYTTHSLGPLIYLTGHRVTHVVGMTAGKRQVTGREQSIASSILCYTDQGAVFHSFQSGLCPRRGFHWSLIGERGAIESSAFPLEERRFLYYRAGTRAGVQGEQSRIDLSPPELYRRYRDTKENAAERVMLHEFANGIRKRRTSSIGIYSALSMSLPGVLGSLSTQQDFKTIEMPKFALAEGLKDDDVTARVGCRRPFS